MMKIHIVVLFSFAVYAHAGVLKQKHGIRRNQRYLLYNPADMSTLIGYQNHHVPDMTSLVNEASANAHIGKVGQTGGTQTSSNSGPYNIPNFPAMGGSVIGSSSNTLTGTGKVTPSSPSGSASFAGTNQWRCDSHVIETCDIQCLDVDPKDGCAFCIPSCTKTLTGHTNPGSQSNTQPGNQPLGAIASNANGAGGALVQLPSSLTGTGNQGSRMTSSPQTGKPSCSYYPPNCPKIYTKLENGCLICTVLKQTSQTRSVVTAGAMATTTTHKPTAATCAPKRCIPPCDRGIILGSDGCPYCLCPIQV